MLLPDKNYYSSW